MSSAGTAAAEVRADLCGGRAKAGGAGEEGDGESAAPVSLSHSNTNYDREHNGQLFRPIMKRQIYPFMPAAVLCFVVCESRLKKHIFLSMKLI